MFPFIQPQEYSKLPVYKDIDWDFKENKPVFVAGVPKIVSGLAAVTGWAYRALNTPRFLEEVYTYDYGCELTALVGRQWQKETKTAEAARYVKEALTQLPYIKGVEDISVDFDGKTVKLSCTLVTVYGKGEVSIA